MQIDLNEIGRRQYDIAKDKGFYDPLRTDEETVCLFYSEVVEAFESYRKKEEPFFMSPEGKPEGWAVELIDIVLRILDYLCSQGRWIDNDIALKVIEEKAVSGKFSEIPFLTIHCIFRINETYCDGKIINLNILIDVILDIFAFLILHKQPIAEIIDAKIEYNRTRPHRHGGKRC